MEGKKGMVVDILDLNELAWSATEDGPKPIIFADVDADVRKRAKPLAAENFSEITPEIFRDLMIFAGTAEGNETSAGSAHGEDIGREQGLEHGEPAASGSGHGGDRQAERILSEQRIRQEGWDAGLARGREEYAEAMRAERERFAAQIGALRLAFEESRDDYRHRLEHETVRLSLLCAARILRREVQADPLALTGAVRTALGQLAASTEVRLIVPAQDETLWRESMALIPGLAHRPRVKGDDAMRAGECRVESDLGIADLSFTAQLRVLEEAMLQAPHTVMNQRETEADPTIGSELREHASTDKYSAPSDFAHETGVHGRASE